jgi:formamidopyrimidine-DNA glycosylase
VPELPDLTAYLTALRPRVVGHPLASISIRSPFVLRSVTPPVDSLTSRVVRGLRLLGKRIVVEFDDSVYLVVHLMIAGRLQWKDTGPAPRTRIVLAVFEFPTGLLILTEAGHKKRASIHVVQGAATLEEFDRGGLDVLASSLETFTEALTRENHTVKRALTDPRLFSGIGNAYSDEILHAAQLSPLKLTSRLTPAEIARLWTATRQTLTTWSERLVTEAGVKFPSKVTAFRPDMAVHGKFKHPCPVCAAPIQRIVYADNECNYCPACQTDGKLLADRGLSRLLKKDWPRSLDDWEEHVAARKQ